MSMKEVKSGTEQLLTFASPKQSSSKHQNTPQSDFSAYDSMVEPISPDQRGPPVPGRMPNLGFAPSRSRNANNPLSWNRGGDRRGWMFSRKSISRFSSRVSSMFNSRRSEVAESRDWGNQHRKSSALKNLNEKQLADLVNQEGGKVFGDYEVYAPDERPSELDPDGGYEEYYRNLDEAHRQEREQERQKKMKRCFGAGALFIKREKPSTNGL